MESVLADEWECARPYEFDALAQIWNMDACRFARGPDGREI